MSTVDFEAVIGLEVHCQLATATKLFCACPAQPPQGQSVSDLVPNSQTCPICVGHPGTLPVLNRRVLEYAVRAGLALNCTIRERSVFARKNYFYPDLPKGYQISQYDLPLCEGGYLEFEVPSPMAGSGRQLQKVSLQRIHLEEDAGKSVHHGSHSIVNLNRAGVPLIEIVSAPDLRTPEQAGAYLRSLHSVVTFLGITDGNMQEGNFRCDANVSVRPRGSDRFGTRVEIKNVNSFRFVEKAIEYEIARQVSVIRSGGAVVQETRLYDSDANRTESMRSKEEAHDYRYFPDPDLMEVRLDPAWIQALRQTLPELPEQKKARYTGAWGLSDYDAGVLCSSRELADFFERAVGSEPALAKGIANLLSGEVLRRLNEESITLAQTRLTPEHLARVAQLSQDRVISSTGAKKALGEAWRSGDSIDAIVEREGLKQVSDTSALEPWVDEVIAAHPAQFAELCAGKEKVMGFFVGQLMKKTGGKANPALLQELIRKRLPSA